VPDPPKSSNDALQLARANVRALLTRSDAFNALPPEKKKEIANHTVQIAEYLAKPEGIPGNQLPTSSALSSGNSLKGSGSEMGKFNAQGAREGAAVAGALLEAINFPDFVSGLITGVFDSIVESSIEQMEAYGKLVADVAKSLNQFRDENVSVNQGRDHLVEKFPDLFEISLSSGDDFFGDGGSGPQVSVKSGVDESAALDRINQDLPAGQEINSLDSNSIESVLVPNARDQLATGRQQLLATMVMMGINRIVVTDGKIAAKVMYDFKARDDFQYARSATQFDYGDKKIINRSSAHESTDTGGEVSGRKGSEDYYKRGADRWTKGRYKYSEQPVLKLASASQETTNSSLETNATLAGEVEVRFKSDHMPLDKIADNFQIGLIQAAAKPGEAQTATTESAGT